MSRVRSTRGKLANEALIGTSGWAYDGWRGPFYPRELAKKDWLAWYAAQFRTAEINGSFYRTPSHDAVRNWRKQTPPDFVLAWKASQFITHWKRLKDTCANSIELMESRVRLLGPKAGPILFQLPARFEADRARLAEFITCCRNGAAMPSNFDTRPGTTTAFSTCCGTMTSRYASRITTRLRRPGK